MTSRRPDPGFWAGKRVLVTGHTGFKGAWLCLLLHRLGARTSGLALPAISAGAFDAMRPSVEGSIADIRDANAVRDTARAVRPDIVLHLAAQALVGEGYARPLETFAVNAQGTANVLDALCDVPPRVALVVTSDKVYRVDGNVLAFNEDSALGGTDPYSASKVAAEQVAACWRELLRDVGCKIATARAGNVIGGGDCAAGRLVPDVLRAHHAGVPVELRHPDSVRAWQYVLDVVSGYLLYAEALWHNRAQPSLNFGPAPDVIITTAELVERLQQSLGARGGWRQGPISFNEVMELRLDARCAQETLGWRADTSIASAVAWIAGWQQSQWRGEDMRRVAQRQIEAWLPSPEPHVIPT